MTRGRFLTSASKFSIESIGGIFDVSLENDRASTDVKPLDAPDVNLAPGRDCAASPNDDEQVQSAQ